MIFCGRVRCAKSIQVALSTFIKALNQYRTTLSERCPQLNVKGAAWLAAFPEPNRTVWIKQDDAGKEFLSASEALEAAADERPFDFDFLGRALDTGFRVARWSTPERFILSVQLARLLSKRGREIGFAHSIRIDPPVELKGVNGGEPYPIIYFDSFEGLSSKGLREKERALLGTDKVLGSEALAEYLDAYCKHVGTDDIPLRCNNNDPVVPPPESYLKAKEAITTHLQYERGRKFLAGEPEPAATENTGQDLNFDEFKN